MNKSYCGTKEYFAKSTCCYKTNFIYLHKIYFKTKCYMNPIWKQRSNSMR